MSYATYITEAIVCGSVVSNTSDKSFLLFTRDAGMLFASARSVREEASKQRHALQDFSHIRVSLVKGKGGWRVGSVEALGNAFMESDNKPARVAVSQLVKLVRRYVHGESALPRAFVDLTDALTLVGTNDYTHREQLLSAFQVRLLSELGYVAHDGELKEVLTTPSLEEAADHVTPSVSLRIKAVSESSATASHL